MRRVQQEKPKVRPKSRSTLMKLLKRVKPKDVAIFTRQMAVMVNAGIPIVEALEVLRQQFAHTGLGPILEDVQHEVEGGLSFSEALGRRRNVFGDFLISMVAVGETGGVLGFTLNRVSEYLEKMIALKGKVRSALAYPAIIFLVAIGATIFLLIAVIPTFAQMFATLNAELPLPTKIVIGLSNFVVQNGMYLFLGFVLLLGVGIYIVKKTDRGRYAFHSVLLNIPILGQVIRKSAISRFARTLGVLIRGGVSILEALEITAKTSGNMVVEKAVLDARKSIGEGKSIAEPLQSSGVFPPMVTQLIAVGEKTGDLPGMLEKLSDFYDGEVENSINTLTSVLEPVMLVFMGVVVGFMLISMYLPIFNMAQLIK